LRIRRQPWYEREWNSCAASLASPAIVVVTGLVCPSSSSSSSSPSTFVASLTPVDSGTTTADLAASPPADAATAATDGSTSATLLALQRSHALGFVRLLLSLFCRGLALLSLSLSLSRVLARLLVFLLAPCFSSTFIHLAQTVISPTFIRSHPLLFLRVFLDFCTTVFFFFRGQFLVM